MMHFSSSGQGSVPVTSIYADNENLSNAIELIDFDDDPIQFQVCDHCGYPGCASGGWLSPRKLGQLVFLMPAFEKMDMGSWEATEFAPPYFTNLRGSILLSDGSFGEFKKLAPKVPNLEQIALVTSYELCRLLQWEAPFRVLGKYPSSLTFRRELLSTTSLPDDDEAIEILLSFFRSLESGEKTMALTTIEASDERPSFFLDAADFIEWNPIVIKADGRHGVALTKSCCVVES